MATDSGRVVVVSDLHLGDKGSLEDFHHDESFAVFAAAYGNLGNTRLILNGDFIDYLQIQPLGALTVPAAVTKTKSVFDQHGPVLQALANFSRTGNRVTLVEGNHDIELLFPKVREAFRSAFHAAGGDVEKLEFADSVVADYPYFHIEHGHQADRLNQFDYRALLANEKTETLNFPWGSRFVHRVFNNVEPDYPFIDKVRPESAAALILYLVDQKLFRTLFIPFMGLEIEDWLGRLRLASLTQPQADAKGPSGEEPLGAFATEWTDMFDSLQTLEYYFPAAASDAAAKGKVVDSVVSELIVRLNENAQRRTQRQDSLRCSRSEEMCRTNWRAIGRLWSHSPRRQGRARRGQKLHQLRNLDPAAGSAEQDGHPRMAPEAGEPSELPGHEYAFVCGNCPRRHPSTGGTEVLGPALQHRRPRWLLSDVQSAAFQAGT